MKKIMPIKKICLAVLAVVLCLSACKQGTGIDESVMLNTEGIEATAPYLTNDHKGNPVLCWTEKDGKDSLYRLKYAVYDHLKAKFGAATTVSVSAGCSASAESMGKVAFKSDGTVMAVFAKKFPQEKNPYAGAIYYSMSRDAGKSWSAATFIHADTAHNYGRSFFDIARLKDGELAAIWLDGRFGKSVKGSALFFNQTTKGKGFGTDTCLDKGTCECCRTEMLVDNLGRIHLAYRSISFPSALSGKQVRDMVYKSSSDNGRSFSMPKPISNDNWEIEGCPHSGPSLAVTNNRIHAIWFTAGGSPGLYTTSAPVSGADFNRRNLVTTSGKHPQMMALPEGKIAVVYEEAVNIGSEKPMEMDHSKHEGDHTKRDSGHTEHEMTMDHSKHGMGNTQSGATKIIACFLANGSVEKSIDISNGHQADHHAVLAAVDKGVLIAWVREEKSGAKIFYSFLKI